MAPGPADPAVLIAVLKDRRDFRLATRGVYRIPTARAPRRAFTFLAFYQPAGFGRSGSRIRWYAPVLGRRTVKRRELLPDEPDHPRANDDYYAYRLGKLLPLPAPVGNAAPRRVTFAFTTLRRLFAARDLLGALGIPPIETLLGAALYRARVPAHREFTVRGGPLGRFRLDFAVFRARGPLAVECDGAGSHGSPAQRRRDRARDAKLRALGWTVLRFTEREIVADASGCALQVRSAAARLGGPAAS